jgi:hypothetical protein
MSNEYAVYPVTTDPQLHTELKRLSETMGTHELTAHIRSLGLEPPDDRDGWDVVYQWGPDGEDEGIVWAEPEDDVDEGDHDLDEVVAVVDGQPVLYGDMLTPGGNRIRDVRES